MQAILTSAFRQVHEQLQDVGGLDLVLSGVTVCIAVHDMADEDNQRLYVAWAGNCAAALISGIPIVRTDQSKRRNQPGRVRLKHMRIEAQTSSHTTAKADELVRIIEKGAEIRPTPYGPSEFCAPGEDWPGMPITRCLGNLAAQKLGALATPQVEQWPMFYEDLDRQSLFLVLSTDGISDCLKDTEILTMLRENIEEDAFFCLDRILLRSRARWERLGKALGDDEGTVDDMTVCLLQLYTSPA